MKVVNSRPTLVYYELQGFQKTTLEYMHRFFDITTLPDPGCDTADILQKASVVFAPMGFVFGRDKIDACRILEVIATPTTGILHIDHDHARERGISVCSLKNQQEFLSTITCTAELTWGLLLAVVRHLIPAHDSVLEGKWNGRHFGKETPRMLSSMMLGIIGLGRLGSWVARYGNAFGMEVYYYDPYVTVEQYTRCDDLYHLAKSSDIVSVHAHLTKETEGLVDRKFIQCMPRGSFIINTARGGIVDEQALLDGLVSGHLAGAGVDMLAGEHLPGFKQKLSDHPLINYARSHDNLLITPKIGGCTIDAWEKTERHLVDLIIRELEERGRN